jgi:hypothetical protein
MQHESDSAQIAVTAAIIAAKLFQAERIARQLALTAKNASAVIVRAGIQAAGLKVIAEFFGELAATTIKQSVVVNLIAVEVSRIRVEEWRSQEFVAHLERARGRVEGDEGAHIADTDRYVQHTMKKMERLELAYLSKIKALKSELDSITRQIRAADVIVVSLRIEAPKTGEYATNLLAIADHIKMLASDISDQIRASRTLLDKMGDHEEFQG